MRTTRPGRFASIDRWDSRRSRRTVSARAFFGETDLVRRQKMRQTKEEEDEFHASGNSSRDRKPPLHHADSLTRSQRMIERQIEQVRRFNRIVTQHVGALEESYLRRGRPLGQARLLHEIGPDGIEVRTLRDRLKLNSGYASPLCARSKGRGLSRWKRKGSTATSDGPPLQHPRGRPERDTYDTLSDQLAAFFLGPRSGAARTSHPGHGARSNACCGPARWSCRSRQRTVRRRNPAWSSI